MRPDRRFCRTVLLAAICAAVSCGGSDEPYRKPTFPVTGQLIVDGQPPSSPVEVVCHSAAGMDQQHPSVSQTMTGADGKFAISTYESGDGVPEGDYVLTFMWGQHNVISASYGGPDKLKGRYNDPKTSKIRFTVKDAEEPIDLGTIELTTK